ncbi:MAG TPA: DNA starvation/stationary phase protection protein [Candidatus Acidoferrales bacterium]|nr:DNA starvation/stationary phase protection protein [Candidatus Acidoferrales bacterium]
MIDAVAGEAHLEAIIDATLADSFPASDPPSWTLGREREKRPDRTRQPHKTKIVGGSEMNSNIGLSAEQREGVAKILNALLANEYVLYTKTRNYHWNVTGPQFNDLHKFFEAQYTELNEVIDDVAERARSLDQWALGTLAEFSQHSALREHPGQYPSAREMIANLLADHEIIIRQLRADLETCAERYHDMGTNDFLTGLMEKHEKMAWMLRAFLQGERL